jgi:hypothetical protein
MRGASGLAGVLVMTRDEKRTYVLSRLAESAVR